MIDRDIKRAAAFVGVVALALAVWLLHPMLLLCFGAILLAILLRRLALLLARYGPLSVGMALALTILLLSGLVAAFSVFAGPRIVEEAGQLLSRLPEMIDRLQQMLHDSVWGDFFMRQMENGDDGMSAWNVVGTIGGTVSSMAGVLTSAVILLALAVYFAASPGLYRHGAVLLVPPAHRGRAREVLDSLGDGLWHWLQGQLIDMVVVALLTGGGLWLLGVPLPFTLGLIAGLLNFVPFFGPVLASIPAALISLDEGLGTALWTAALYVGVQQLEGNVIMPIVQRQTTQLPPALTVVAIAGMGLLFGLPGVFLATPLLLVTMILVRMLWVEDALGDRPSKRQT